MRFGDERVEWGTNAGDGGHEREDENCRGWWAAMALLVANGLLGVEKVVRGDLMWRVEQEQMDLTMGELN